MATRKKKRKKNPTPLQTGLLVVLGLVGVGGAVGWWRRRQIRRRELEPEDPGTWLRPGQLPPADPDQQPLALIRITHGTDAQGMPAPIMSSEDPRVQFDETNSFALVESAVPVDVVVSVGSDEPPIMQAEVGEGTRLIAGTPNITRDLRFRVRRHSDTPFGGEDFNIVVGGPEGWFRTIYVAPPQ